MLHSIFELGQRRRWCTRNPVKLAEGPRVRRNRTRIRFLTQEELEALVRTTYPDDALGSIERTLYVTAAMTGLRENELLAPRWRHVDWVNERIRVVTGYVRGEFTDPKSAKSARSVPMATRVARELERLYQRSAWRGDDDLVFAHPELGTPLDRSKLLKRLKAAEKRAGVRQVTFHELRHTFGARMAAAGIPLRTIQEWMGHEDTATTAIDAHYQPHRTRLRLSTARSRNRPRRVSAQTMSVGPLERVRDQQRDTHDRHDDADELEVNALGTSRHKPDTIVVHSWSWLNASIATANHTPAAISEAPMISAPRPT